MEHSDAEVGALDQGESAIWKVISILEPKICSLIAIGEGR